MLYPLSYRGNYLLSKGLLSFLTGGLLWNDNRFDNRSTIEPIQGA